MDCIIQQISGKEVLYARSREYYVALESFENRDAVVLVETMSFVARRDLGNVNSILTRDAYNLMQCLQCIVVCRIL